MVMFQKSNCDAAAIDDSIGKGMIILIDVGQSRLFLDEKGIM